MSALTDLARGQECTVRLPCCNGDPSTTVFAHYRLAGTCGTGKKPPDFQGAWACSVCHDECDGRTHRFERDFVRLHHAEGMIRTQYQIITRHTGTLVRYLTKWFLRGAA